MATIAYLLLCRGRSASALALAGRLSAAGDLVALHVDRCARSAETAAIRKAFAGNPSVVLARSVRCDPGGWSAMQAVLNAARAALAAFPQATHLYLLSEDCLPIKPAARLRAALEAEDCDHIESLDVQEADAGGGAKPPGPIRRQEDAAPRRRAGLRALVRRPEAGRAPPRDLRIMTGSRWWCLRRATVEAVLALLAARSDLRRFFRAGESPEATLFQTLVRHLVPGDEIRSRAPTFQIVAEDGRPVSFYNDHFELLTVQEGFFAHRISAGAAQLRARLLALHAAPGPGPSVSGGGAGIYRFLSGRGRIGQRFGGRAWERGVSLGPDHDLMLVICGKRAVARRLAGRVRRILGMPTVEFPFDDAGAELPDLGGIERGLAKRGRHRGAFLRLVFESYGTDRLLLFLDPSDLDVMIDLQGDGARLRMLEIACPFSQADLLGHAREMGLLSQGSPPGLAALVLPVLGQQIKGDSARLRAAGFPALYRLEPGLALSEAALVLAKFLEIPYDTARGIADTATFFDD
ncbi:DUF5928 domain-containing protein [Rhodovulum sp. YEN HP10]|uniref:DUF5928 domain-containing protein n=1 Tax=Rhodovulum sp. HP10 TaxID=3387397 RepID=UPI0039DF978B